MKGDKVLIHVCCAPDAVHFIRRFREDHPDKELVAFFYDPNIHPYEEYKLRLLETERICEELGIPLIEGEYDVENWLRAVEGFEKEPERGRRCSICFDYRLDRSARKAKELGCSAITTTLLMSPKKRFDQLKASGEKVARIYGLSFVAVDYRKGGGVQEMFKEAREKELYQQDYCGCIYGLFQQKGEKSMWDLSSFGGRRPGSKEETLFIKRIRLFAERKGLKVREIEFPFLNWRVLRGGLWVKKRAIPSLVLAFSGSIRGKVRASAEKVGRDLIHLNKQFVRIVLVDRLKDVPIRDFKGNINPTFIVERRFEGSLLENRVEAELETEFLPGRSRILVVGDPSAKRIIGFPADTLQDGRGLTLEDARGIIEESLPALSKREECLVFLGAHSLGGAGVACFKERFSRDIEEVVNVYELKTVGL